MIKKFALIILILFVFSFNLETIRSLTVTSTGGVLKTLGLRTKVKTGDDGISYYCSEFYKPAPEGHNCYIDTSWDKASVDAIAIGTIISSNQTYINKEIEINAYLANKGYTYNCNNGCIQAPQGIRRGFNNTADYKGSYYISINDNQAFNGKGWIKQAMSDLLDSMISKYQSVKNISLSIGTFSYNNGRYESHVTVNNSFDNNYNIDYSGNGLSCYASNKTKNGFDLSCSYNGTSGTSKISVSISSSISFQTSTRYNCGAKYQKLFINETKTLTPHASGEKNITTIKQSCENEIKNATKEKKVQVYQKYKGLGYEWNKILNFGNSSCEGSECKYNNSISCLTSSNGINNMFNSNNISCYNDTISANGKINYCLTTFNLKNKLGKTQFISPTSGRLLFNVENGIIAQGVLSKTCYIYNYTQQVIPDNNYSDYIGNLKFGGKNLIQIENSKLNLNKDTTDPSKYYASLTTNYKINKVYSKNGSGDIVYGTTDQIPCTNCKFIGYGLISRLNEISNNKQIDFSIEYKSVFKQIEIEPEDKCTYTTTPEIIENPGNPKEKLNLEFRIIDTNNPFPGKEGNVRLVGTNWCDGNNCRSDNDIIKKQIINEKNSYSQNPKYKITLTSSDIQEIRKYNKNTSYDDYKFKCDEKGDNCSSNFIKNLKEGIVNEKNISNKLEVQE